MFVRKTYPDDKKKIAMNIPICNRSGEVVLVGNGLNMFNFRSRIFPLQKYTKVKFKQKNTML